MDPLVVEVEIVIEVVVASMAGVCVWVASRAVFNKRDPAVVRRIGDLAEASARGDSDGRGRFLKVFGLIGLMGGRLHFKPSSLEQLLASAGVKRLKPEELHGLRVVLALGGIFIATIFGPLFLIAAPVLAGVGFKLPELFLKGRISRRREEIEAELPDVVDLLAVSTGAGLNIALSLNRVAEAAHGALGDELRRTVARIDLGVPRAEALSEFASRNDVEDVDGLVSTIVGAERFGTQLGPSLAALSGEVRGKRKRRAEEQGRRAPVKMLFPLVFLILPGFILLTLVPLVLSTFRSLGF